MAKVVVHFTGTSDTVEFTGWTREDADSLMSGLAAGSNGTTNVTSPNGRRVVVNRDQMTFAELVPDA